MMSDQEEYEKLKQEMNHAKNECDYMFGFNQKLLSLSICSIGIMTSLCIFGSNPSELKNMRLVKTGEETLEVHTTTIKYDKIEEGTIFFKENRGHDYYCKDENGKEKEICYLNHLGSQKTFANMESLNGKYNYTITPKEVSNFGLAFGPVITLAGIIPYLHARRLYAPQINEYKKAKKRVKEFKRTHSVSE